MFICSNPPCTQQCTALVREKNNSFQVTSLNQRELKRLDLNVLTYLWAPKRICLSRNSALKQEMPGLFVKAIGTMESQKHMARDDQYRYITYCIKATREFGVGIFGKSWDIKPSIYKGEIKTPHMLKRHVEILSEKLQDFTSAWNQPIKKKTNRFSNARFSAKFTRHIKK